MQSRDISILIVEDEHLIALSIQRELQKMGYNNSVIAHDYESAVTAAKHYSFGLAILDIALGNDKDGIDLAATLHTHHDIPTIFVTSNVQILMTERARNVRSYGYLLKPINFDELYIAAEMAFDKHSKEKKILLQEDILHATLAAVSDALITTDGNGIILHSNNAAGHLLGKYFQQKTDPHSITSFIHNANCLDFQAMCEYYKNGRDLTLTKDNFPQYIHIKCSPLVDKTWHKGAVFILRDVTEERNTHTSLFEREQHHIALLDSLSEAVVFTDLRGQIINANSRVKDIFGIEKEDFIGTNERQWIDSTRHEDSVLQQYMNNRKQGIIETYSVVVHRADNTLRTVHVHATPLTDNYGTVIGSIAAIQDISENEKTKKELREAETTLYHFIENAPIAFIRKNLRTNEYVYYNREFERIAGGNLEDFKNNIDYLIHEGIDLNGREEILRKTKEWKENNMEGILHLTYRLKNLQGEYVWTDNYIYSDNDEQTGEILYANQFTVDITTLKKAEEIITQSLEENFRKTVHNLQNLVVRLYRRNDGKIAYAMRDGKLAGDLTTEKILGKSIDEIFGEEQSLLSLPPVMRAFEGESVLEEIPIPNTSMILLFSLNPIKVDGKVTEVVGSAIDITQLRQVEKLLDASKQQFGILSEIAPIGILISEQIGSLLTPKFANKEFQKITGLSIEQFTALEEEMYDNFFHPDDNEAFISTVTEWLADDSRTHLHQTYRFFHPTKGYRWLDNFLAKYFEDNGKIIVIQTARDITEQKENEITLRHLASIPEQSDIPIVELNSEGTVMYANNSALSQFGEDTTNKDSYNFLPIFASEQFDEQCTIEYSHNNCFYEMEIHRLSNATYRIFFYDITTEKRARNELLDALAQERQLNELKTHFVRTVSHEFRTPLTSILMSAELLRHHFDKMSADQRKNELDKIFKRVVQLEEFMNDFITHASIDSLRETFLPDYYSIQQILDEIQISILPLISTRHQRLQLVVPHPLQTIFVDKSMIAFIVISLLKNASRYSPEHATITLEFLCTESIAYIKITDTGIGIKSTELSDLFSPFIRGSNVGNELGSGLGLYIVKEFVELHGGTVTVESEEDSGSTFTVTLPLTKRNL